jgi:hypothetical protein
MRLLTKNETPMKVNDNVDKLTVVKETKIEVPTNAKLINDDLKRGKPWYNIHLEVILGER